MTINRKPTFSTNGIKVFSPVSAKVHDDYNRVDLDVHHHAENSQFCFLSRKEKILSVFKIKPIINKSLLFLSRLENRIQPLTSILPGGSIILVAQKV